MIVESKSNILRRGKYQLKYDVDGPGNGSRKSDTFTANKDTQSTDMFAGKHIFTVTNDRTGEVIFVSHEDINIY